MDPATTIHDILSELSKRTPGRKELVLTLRGLSEWFDGDGFFPSRLDLRDTMVHFVKLINDDYADDAGSDL